MALNLECMDYEVSGVKPCWGKWKWFVVVVTRDRISSAVVTSGQQTSWHRGTVPPELGTALL